MAALGCIISQWQLGVCNRLKLPLESLYSFEQITSVSSPETLLGATVFTE